VKDSAVGRISRIRSGVSGGRCGAGRPLGIPPKCVPIVSTDSPNAATSAEAKNSQAAAAYQATPKNGQSCSSCALFRPPSSCLMVEGTISPDGWCKFYVKKS